MKRLLRRYLGALQFLRDLPALRWLGSSVLHPRLWHLNRRSAAGGLAIGLACSLIPGPLQMPGAALLCLLTRQNLPLALAATLVSNPLTIVPLYMCAFALGKFFTPGDPVFTAPPAPDWQNLAQLFSDWGHWLIALGRPLLIGLPLLALLLAAGGYILMRCAWSAWLRLTWLKRRKARTRRP